MPERGDAIPEAITLYVCDRCGRKDFASLGIRPGHFSRGNRCGGVIRAVEYRAAQPEADRAPGEVDAVVAILDGWEHDEPVEQIAEDIIDALDALRSEQGQSRDDTVTLAEAAEAFVRETPSTHPLIGEIGVQAPAAVRYDTARNALLQALRRVGAGRAEGEDRDTENER